MVEALGYEASRPMNENTGYLTGPVSNVHRTETQTSRKQNNTSVALSTVTNCLLKCNGTTEKEKIDFMESESLILT
jgi:hypothetical protein